VDRAKEADGDKDENNDTGNELKLESIDATNHQEENPYKAAKNQGNDGEVQVDASMDDLKSNELHGLDS